MIIGDKNMTETLKKENSQMHSRERVLYMDEFLAVFNKQPGEICESFTTSCTESKDTYVPEIFKQYVGKNSPKFCQCFNRLDRPVSGANIILFEKNIFPLLQNQFTNNQTDRKTVKKLYWAIVEGVLPKESDFKYIEHYLKFDPKKQKAYVFNQNERKTKLAKLAWRSIGHGENYSFIEIELLTGRTHQIRAQLAHIGLHIKGDVKYGARRQDTLPGIRLHARHLHFLHPKLNSMVSITAPLPTVDPLWKAFEDCV